MSNNHPGLLTKLIPIMFIDSQKIYMILNKPLELGMVDLVLFFFLNDFVRGQNDTTLFTKNKGNGILLVRRNKWAKSALLLIHQPQDQPS
jgi:hypothetical protein